MKPTVKLGVEYPTRGGGKAVVYRDDGRDFYPYVGAHQDHDGKGCEPMSWNRQGRVDSHYISDYDLILPRTVMVPVEVPEWAKFVITGSTERQRWFQFSEQGSPIDMPLNDWIASLEGEK